MKAALRRLLALEKTRTLDPLTYERDRELDIRAMTCAERALAQTALGLLVNRQTEWDEHDERDWGWHKVFMAAKAEIEDAGSDVWSYASALMTRGRRRRLGFLEDSLIGPCQPWRELDAFPCLDADAWSAIAALAADFRSGVIGANDLICRH